MKSVKPYIVFLSGFLLQKYIKNYVMNSIKLSNRMDAIFMSSKNSKTLEVHRLLLLNLADKMIEVIKRSDKYVALSNLSMYYTWKNRKKSKTTNLKYRSNM